VRLWKVVFDQAGSDDFLSLKTARHRHGLKLHHAGSFLECKYFSFPFWKKENNSLCGWLYNSVHIILREICFLNVLNFHVTLTSKWMYYGSGRSARSSYIPHVWHRLIILTQVKNLSETLERGFWSSRFWLLFFFIIKDCTT
jgi:hypothetical protein